MTPISASGAGPAVQVSLLRDAVTGEGDLALRLVRLSVQENVDAVKADYLGTILDTYA